MKRLFSLLFVLGLLAPSAAARAAAVTAWSSMAADESLQALFAAANEAYVGRRLNEIAQAEEEAAGDP